MTVPLSLIPTQMARGQQGATLLIAIVFLLIITVLGISSMRGVSLESRITANLKQQKTLMGAAEAGLRMGENSIDSNTPPDVIKDQDCTTKTITCIPWSLGLLLDSPPKNVKNITDLGDTPALFDAAHSSNVATVESTQYNTKIQWYVVEIGKPNISSQNDCALKRCGVMYYEVNACASTVLCTSDTTTQRVILRTVIARYYQP